MIPAAPIIVLIPLVGGIAALGLQRWRSAETLFAALTCLGTAALVIALPNTSVPILPSAALVISPDASLDILGRTLRLQTEDRMTLGLLFVASAILFLLSWRAPQGRAFLPLGLMVLAASAAALLVRPFLYAALAFEAAAAFAVIMIQAERGGERSTLGALRYLSAATLAMPLLLLAGWVIDQANATDSAEYGTAIVLLLASFGLLLGAIPLFTWVHPVARDAPPLVAAFLATAGVGASGFLLLKLTQAFEWLRLDPLFIQSLTAGGLLAITFGGVLAWAQRSFSRLMACAILVEIGCLLLNLSSPSQAGIEAIAFSLPARALALGVFGLGVWRLRTARGSDDFGAVQGLRDVWACLALGVGGLSLAGMPGTLGFVSRWLTAQAYGFGNLESLALLVFAQVSIGICLVRGLSTMFQHTPGESRSTVNPSSRELAAVDVARSPAGIASRLSQQLDERLPTTIGTIVLLALGMWPEAFTWLAKAAADSYALFP